MLCLHTQPFPLTQPTHNAFDDDDFRPALPIFKASEYHKEHAHELEAISKASRNRYVEPRPLTVPESPQLVCN